MALGMAAFGGTALAPDEPDLTTILERGAQGVIAGCTEIPMVMTAEDVDVPYFDALVEHVRAAVEFALAD